MRIRLQDIEDDVALEMSCGSKRAHEESAGVSGSSASHKGKDPVVGPLDAMLARDEELAQRLQKKLKQTKVTDSLLKEKRDWVHDQWAQWAYEAAIPFHALSLESFTRACMATGEYGSSYRPPSMYMYREPLLKRAVLRTKESLVDHVAEWGKTGCSLMTDGWSDRKMRSVINLCVHCRLGTTFYKSDEDSEESHTGEYIFKWVDKCIDEIGADKVIQVVTDNHSANMAAKELLKAKRPRIFWTSCAAHTVDLMLEGISKLPAFKGVIAKAREITVFIYSHHKTLAMMRKATEKEIDLELPYLLQTF
jgi:hypothetical protein